MKVLIGDEPEEGMENLMEVEIPQDVEEKLKDLDVKEQQQIENEAQELLKQESEEKSQNETSEGLERWTQLYCFKYRHLTTAQKSVDGNCNFVHVFAVKGLISSRDDITNGLTAPLKCAQSQQMGKTANS